MKILTTVAGLAGLTPGSVVIDVDDNVWVKGPALHGNNWHSPFLDDPDGFGHRPERVLEGGRVAVLYACGMPPDDVDPGVVHVRFAAADAPSLTYAATDGTVTTRIDDTADLPKSPRERAILRALLGRTIDRLDDPTEYAVSVLTGDTVGYVRG